MPDSNVGARLFLIGKDATLAGLKEIQSATANLNKEIAAGAKSSKVAAAGSDEQAAALAKLNVEQDLYQKNLKESQLATANLAKVGKTAFFGLAAAGAVWGYESIKWAQNYQTQLVRLRTQAGLTVTAMNAIGAAAMKNAAGLGISPTAYVTAAYHPASTGMSVAQTIAITNNAAKLAAIGGAPVEDTTIGLTGIMKSYGFGAGQTTKTAAILNAAVGAGNMRFSDLNSALSSGIASTSKTFGISDTSFLGALAFMTDRGVPASQAGTHLRMAESLMGAPSAEATKLLTAAGMSSTTAASSTSAMSQMLQTAGVSTTQLSSALRDNSGGGGIYNALNLLHKDLTAGGLSPAMQAAMISRSFGGGKMGSTIEMMYNNVGGLGAKTQQIDKNGTQKKLLQDWNAETQTLDFQLKKLGSTVETLGTQFGTKLIPVLTAGAKALTDVLGFLSKNKEVAVGLGTAITAVLVPAIGLYLKRSLLGAEGAIQTVIRGYAQLIGIQAKEDGSLAGNDAALSINDRALLLNAKAQAADRSAGVGGVGGGVGTASRTVGNKLLKAAGIAAVGYTAASMVSGGHGYTDNPNASRSTQLRQFGGAVIGGATTGAEIGSIIGPEGTVIGGALGAGAGAVYAERHSIAHAVSSGWDDLFGGGNHNASASTSGKVTINNHVYIDGKEVTKAVIKNTKTTAART